MMFVRKRANAGGIEVALLTWTCFSKTIFLTNFENCSAKFWDNFFGEPFIVEGTANGVWIWVQLNKQNENQNIQKLIHKSK